MRRVWAAAAWAIVIAITSSTVIGPKAFTKAVVANTPVRLTEDGFAAFWAMVWWLPVKGWHFAEFLILAWLLRVPGLSPRIALAGAIGYAILDEWHQTFVPERGGRWTDVMIDAAGAVTGVLLHAWWVRRRVFMEGEQGPPVITDESP